MILRGTPALIRTTKNGFYCQKNTFWKLTKNITGNLFLTSAGLVKACNSALLTVIKDQPAAYILLQACILTGTKLRFTAYADLASGM